VGRGFSPGETTGQSPAGAKAPAHKNSYLLSSLKPALHHVAVSNSSG